MFRYITWIALLTTALVISACDRSSSPGRSSSPSSPVDSPTEAATQVAAPSPPPQGAPEPTYQVCSGAMKCESQRDAFYALGWSKSGTAFAYVAESDNRDMGLEYGATLYIVGDTDGDKGPWWYNGADGDTDKWNITEAWNAGHFDEILRTHAIDRGSGNTPHELPWKDVSIEIRDAPAAGTRLNREIVVIQGDRETRLHKKEVSDLVADRKPRVRYFESPKGDRIAIWADFPTGVIEGMVGREQVVRVVTE